MVVVVEVVLLVIGTVVVVGVSVCGCGSVMVVVSSLLSLKPSPPRQPARVTITTSVRIGTVRNISAVVTLVSSIFGIENTDG
ncbi:hypothetical protein [Haladaptatus sp. DYF46]|uniref:hypothetical protein n=1 Tax=Haladaptatus sp. DYF46 TaxID=2886041 RepID=UPI001E4B0583|nr:hypothetical protein [Haladaptatus sp. DYF46]